jgi:hypothetical protein
MRQRRRPYLSCGGDADFQIGGPIDTWQSRLESVREGWGRDVARDAEGEGEGGVETNCMGPGARRGS